MRKLLAPIKYFGGKNVMRNKIYELFPDKGSYTTYIEPFGGSYGVGLGMEYIPEIEIYNDLYKNVYSFYKVLNDSELFDEFRKKCELTYYSEDLRKEYINVLRKDDDSISIVDRAFMYFYVNRTSRNSIGGISINGYSVRRGMSKSVSDFLSAVERLPELHDRLSKTIVLNRDAVELIKKYDDEKVFFYCDPPYDWSTRTSTRYAVDMDGDKQDEFLDAVINSKAKILISGYDCDRYKILTDNGFEKYQFTSHVYDTKNNSTEKIETLWRNYKKEQQLELNLNF